MVFIREIYIKRQSFKLENHLEWKPNDCITIVGINKSSEQMIYYDSYQVLKLLRKVLILQIKLSNSNMNIRVDFILY